MIKKTTANMQVKMVGSSHYFGDIYKDLEIHWIQKAMSKEFVVSEMILPVSPDKINAIIERNIQIKNVSREAFFQK